MTTSDPSDPATQYFNLHLGRSAAIVAAYLMYSRHLDTDGALALIRQSRPNVEYVPSTKYGV